MTTTEGHFPKKARITNEQITEMKRLLREGKSISAIAREIGCHRQTVRMHLREKYGDIIADEVRKQVLTEELRGHFQQLLKFAQADLKLRLDASLPDYKRVTVREPRGEGPIFLGGMLAIPYQGGAVYMAEEWVRMYDPSPRESHLLESLREHTLDSPLWVHWDSWRRKVADYEAAGRRLLEWLEDRMEAELFGKVEPTKMEQIQRWLFGNIVLMASGEKLERLQTFREEVLDDKGVIIMRSPEKDADGSVALYKHLSGILDEARQRSEWATLRSATAELREKESQLELRHIAKEMNYALVSVELMHAFRGRCHLCPV